MSRLKICLAGATGWAGSVLSQGIIGATDLELVAALSRSNAGKTLGEVLGIEGLNTPIFGTVEDALKTGPDIFVEYTKPEAAKFHILSALKNGAHVVVGTSGLSNEDYEEIDGVGEGSPARSSGGGKLCTDRCSSSEICRDGGKIYPPLGSH